MPYPKCRCRIRVLRLGPITKGLIMVDSFGCRATLRIEGRQYTICVLSAIEKNIPSAARLPYSLKILLENLLRREDGRSVRAGDIQALASWQPRAEPQTEIAFTPSRVLLQD